MSLSRPVVVIIRYCDSKSFYFVDP